MLPRIIEELGIRERKPGRRPKHGWIELDEMLREYECSDMV